jgi:hypothetical protein
MQNLISVLGRRLFLPERNCPFLKHLQNHEVSLQKPCTIKSWRFIIDTPYKVKVTGFHEINVFVNCLNRKNMKVCDSHKILVLESTYYYIRIFAVENIVQLPAIGLPSVGCQCDLKH